ncbi:MAG TPA: CAP domain-containing protein [Steroidobacteraceae bacterium]
MLTAVDWVKYGVLIVLGALIAAVGVSSPRPLATPSRNASVVLTTARTLRLQGCDGHIGVRVALRASGPLNAAALQWSRASSLKSAVEQSGYRAEQSAALHVNGDAGVLQQAIKSRLCTQLTDANFVDLGSSQSGRDTWIIIAAPFAPPASIDASTIAAELLQRINHARAQSRRCGNKAFAAAPALQSNALLNRAAERHAQDMISHNYFAHEGHDGSSPAQRVTATGYRFQIVGENIASGPESAAEAAEGWLASPAHCENIMDARFSESGIAYAANGSGTPRIYWVQEFATPR